MKINSKKHEYKGIIFQSSLELFCYKELEKNGLYFKYDSESVEMIHAKKYNFDFFKHTKKMGFHAVKTKVNSKISHTTDFIIFDKTHLPRYIIETKGYSNEKFQIYRKLFFNYIIKHMPTVRGYYMPSNQYEVKETISMILKDMF